MKKNKKRLKNDIINNAYRKRGKIVMEKTE